MLSKELLPDDYLLKGLGALFFFVASVSKIHTHTSSVTQTFTGMYAMLQTTVL